MSVVPIRRTTRGHAESVGANAYAFRHPPPFERWRRPPLGTGAIHGVAAEVGTVAAGEERLLVELVLRRFTAEADGRIAEIGQPQLHFEEPGLSRGRRIRDGEASCALMSADVIVCSDAGFIRPLLERRLPESLAVDGYRCRQRWGGVRPVKNVGRRVTRRRRLVAAMVIVAPQAA